jgi:hypothetical protein
VLNKFLDLSHAMADAASAGRTQPRMGPSHLYLEFKEAGTPTVDGIPGKLFKCVPWFDMEALLALFQGVIFIGFERVS